MIYENGKPIDSQIEGGDPELAFNPTYVRAVEIGRAALAPARAVRSTAGVIGRKITSLFDQLSKSNGVGL